jgi:hypothetical protein
MKRDKRANDALDALVKQACVGIPVHEVDHNVLARKAFTKTARPRRRELTISRLAQQLRAKLRRKARAEQPIIPGLELSVR